MTPFPTAFEERMQTSLGLEWKEFQAAHDIESPVSTRINPAKNNRPIGDRVPWSSRGTYLDKRPVFTLDPLLHAGAYYVQDASSMFLEQAIIQTIDLSQPLRILDLCAAPGGKSTHLLSLVGDDSLVVSNDVIGSRASILSENLQKWGHSNVVVARNDPSAFKTLEGYFDLVVIDAPCSGEGLFRKDPGAMQEWSPDVVELCSRRQRRIIHDVWPALRQNGILVYCTCTFSEKENEDHMQSLAAQKLGDSIALRVDPTWGIEEVKCDASYGYRFYPHRLRGEGFFMSVFRKSQTASPFHIKTKASFSVPSKKTAAAAGRWIQDPESFDLLLHDDLIVAVPGRWSTDIQWLSERLNILTRGTALGRQKHETFVPDQALALARFLNKDNVNLIELNHDQALTYLRKDNLNLDVGQRGFAGVTHQGLVLGWVNVLDRRINNLYPAPWRIRMGS